MTLMDKLVKLDSLASLCEDRIRAWEIAAGGDSNDVEHDAGFELVTAVKFLIENLGDLTKESRFSS